jgi:biopolymer transport protein ExbB/TolQ
MFTKYFAILNEGGFFMYPILACSIVALAVMAERFYALYFGLRLNSAEFTRKVLQAIEGGHINKALDYCNRFAKHPLAKVLTAGLLKANRGDKEIERAMEGAYLDVAPVIQKRAGSLAVMANIATLLGLLGTVQGLIRSFHGVIIADVATKQQMLAQGIAVALLATAFGLLVAIPCLITYYMLTTRQNKILDSIQHAATELLNLVSASNRDLRAGPARVTDLNRGRGS